VLLSAALDSEISVSDASEMRWWRSLFTFFGALAGLCNFLGIALTTYCAKHAQKAIKKQVKHESQRHLPPHAFIIPSRTHKRNNQLAVTVSRTRIPSSSMTQMYHIEVLMLPWLGIGINGWMSAG
jgi:hypothetical protein